MSAPIVKDIKAQPGNSILSSFVSTHKTYFRGEREKLNPMAILARKIGHYSLYFGALSFGYVAAKNFPFSFNDLMSGLGVSCVIYTAASYIRHKKMNHFEGSLEKMYLDGVSILQKKWQIIEAVSWIGITALFGGLSLYMLRAYPQRAAAVSFHGAGVALGYWSLDLSHRLIKNLTH